MRARETPGVQQRVLRTTSAGAEGTRLRVNGVGVTVRHWAPGGERESELGGNGFISVRQQQLRFRSGNQNSLGGADAYSSSIPGECTTNSHTDVYSFDLFTLFKKTHSGSGQHPSSEPLRRTLILVFTCLCGFFSGCGLKPVPRAGILLPSRPPHPFQLVIINESLIHYRQLPSPLVFQPDPGHVVKSLNVWDRNTTDCTHTGFCCQAEVITSL